MDRYRIGDILQDILGKLTALQIEHGKQDDQGGCKSDFIVSRKNDGRVVVGLCYFDFPLFFFFFLWESRDNGGRERKKTGTRSFLYVRTAFAFRLPCRPSWMTVCDSASLTREGSKLSSINRMTPHGIPSFSEKRLRAKVCTLRTSVRSLSNTCPGHHPFSIPRPDYARCPHRALPSILSKIPHRYSQPRPPCLPALPLLLLTVHAPQSLLLSLLCLLAGGVRCWSGICADQAEQAEVDHQDRAQARLARSGT